MLKNDCLLFRQDVSLYPQIFSKFWLKDSLAFFSKRGKTSELSFFRLKFDLRF